MDPFTSNRVRLKVPEGQNDYINASPITLKSTRTGRSKDYIATQVGFCHPIKYKALLMPPFLCVWSTGSKKCDTWPHLAYDLARNK